MLTETDPLGHVTTNGYDVFGNLTSTRDALGGTTTYAYSPEGNLRTVTDAAGEVTSYLYDRYGFMTQSRDRLGNVSLYTNDANGRRTKETRTRTTASGVESLETTYVYDGNGRVVETRQPDGSVSRTTFNALGLEATRVDALGRVTTMAYDELGQLIRTSYPDGTIEETAYDDQNVPVKERFIDFALRYNGGRVLMEMKYQLPRSGDALTRLVAQMRAALETGDEVVIVTFKTVVQDGPLRNALGTDFSKIRVVTGFPDLVRYMLAKFL